MKILDTKVIGGATVVAEFDPHTPGGSFHVISGYQDSVTSVVTDLHVHVDLDPDVAPQIRATTLRVEDDGTVGSRRHWVYGLRTEQVPPSILDTLVASARATLTERLAAVAA